MNSAARQSKFSIYQPERKNTKAKPGLSEQNRLLLFSSERNQLRRLKHLVGITLSYLVIQSFFTEIIAKTAAGKASSYGLNCMFQNNLLEKNVYDFIITFQSICLINYFLIIHTLLYICLLLLILLAT